MRLREALLKASAKGKTKFQVCTPATGPLWTHPKLILQCVDGSHVIANKRRDWDYVGNGTVINRKDEKGNFYICS